MSPEEQGENENKSIGLGERGRGGEKGGERRGGRGGERRGVGRGGERRGGGERGGEVSWLSQQLSPINL